MAVSPRCSSALALLALATSSLGAQTETPSAAFVPNQGDAWSFTLDRLARYFDDALSSQHQADELLRFHLRVDRGVGAFPNPSPNP